MLEISYINDKGEKNYCTLSDYPDYCPICKKGIEAKFLSAHLVESCAAFGNKLIAIFKCNYRDCRRPFFAFYEESGDRSQFDYYFLKRMFTKTFIDTIEFPELIEKISEKFTIIFNQSNLAEENGLFEICGAGYRRALEFLVKDYIVHKKLATIEVIKEKPLGKCINEHVKDEDIKEMARRAAWLGNDETHYFKKWGNRDVADLKNLIELTQNYINSDLLKDKYKKEML